MQRITATSSAPVENRIDQAIWRCSITFSKDFMIYDEVSFDPKTEHNDTFYMIINVWYHVSVFSCFESGQFSEYHPHTKMEQYEVQPYYHPSKIT